MKHVDKRAGPVAIPTPVPKFTKPALDSAKREDLDKRGLHVRDRVEQTASDPSSDRRLRNVKVASGLCDGYARSVNMTEKTGLHIGKSLKRILDCTAADLESLSQGRILNGAGAEGRQGHRAEPITSIRDIGGGVGHLVSTLFGHADQNSSILSEIS